MAVAPTSTAPTRSSRAPVPWVGTACHSTGRTRSPRAGRAITARQLNESAKSPPINGPSAATAAAVPTTLPRAVVRTSLSYRALTMAMLSTGTAAAPAPCIIRAARSNSNEGASAPSSAPAVMMPTPTTSGSRIPARSATRPYTAVATASISAYGLMIHEAPPVDMPNSAAMAGRVTATAEVPIPARPNRRPTSAATRPASVGLFTGSSISRALDHARRSCQGRRRPW